MNFWVAFWLLLSSAVNASSYAAVRSEKYIPPPEDTRHPKSISVIQTDYDYNIPKNQEEYRSNSPVLPTVAFQPPIVVTPIQQQEFVIEKQHQQVPDMKLAYLYVIPDSFQRKFHYCKPNHIDSYDKKVKFQSSYSQNNLEPPVAVIVPLIENDVQNYDSPTSVVVPPSEMYRVPKGGTVYIAESEDPYYAVIPEAREAVPIFETSYVYNIPEQMPENYKYQKVHEAHVPVLTANSNYVLPGTIVPNAVPAIETSSIYNVPGHITEEYQHDKVNKMYVPVPHSVIPHEKRHFAVDSIKTDEFSNENHKNQHSDEVDADPYEDYVVISSDNTQTPRGHVEPGKFKNSSPNGGSENSEGNLKEKQTENGSEIISETDQYNQHHSNQKNVIGKSDVEGVDAVHENENHSIVSEPHYQAHTPNKQFVPGNGHPVPFQVVSSPPEKTVPSYSYFITHGEHTPKIYKVEDGKFHANHYNPALVPVDPTYQVFYSKKHYPIPYNFFYKREPYFEAQPFCFSCRGSSLSNGIISIPSNVFPAGEQAPIVIGTSFPDVKSQITPQTVVVKKVSSRTSDVSVPQESSYPHPPAVPVAEHNSYPYPPAVPVRELSSFPYPPAVPVRELSSYPYAPAVPVRELSSYPYPPAIPVRELSSYPYPPASLVGEHNLYPYPPAVPESEEHNMYPHLPEIDVRFGN